MQAWQDWIEKVTAELGQEAVDKWLKTLRVTHFDAQNLHLEADDPFQLSWFEEQVRPKLKGSFFNNNQKPISVHLQLPGKPPPKKHSRKTKTKEPEPELILEFPKLDPHHTFDTYICPEENRLLHTLFTHLHEESGTYNPIYLHGPKGSGKTHLLMALANEWQERGFKPLYVTAKTFTEHVVAAIRSHEMIPFREIYRSVDLLLIDDVDYFSRKWATQEELFHTFNTLHLARKQIVLASYYAPNELEEIEPRLVSRFEWGLTESVMTLNKEEQQELLKQESARLNLPLSKQIIDFLIRIFGRNCGNLLKALKALVLRSHLEKMDELSLPLVERLLADMIRDEKKRRVKVEDVIKYAATQFGITIDDILGGGQTRETVLPRQLAMYLCRENLKLPYKQIGSHFDRDHSTVMTSVRAIAAALKNNDPSVTHPMQALSKKLDL